MNFHNLFIDQSLTINIEMINRLSFHISPNLIQKAIDNLPYIDHKLSLNQSTGSFFHDEWEIREEFSNTVWAEILDTIPYPKGEARLIRLQPNTCYPQHADIDDRWHMTITGEYCYLVDLDSNELFQTDEIGRWYEMDTSKRHSAVNFGSKDRIQLVIRKLLPNPDLSDSLNVRLILTEKIHSRFAFDNIISPWLNLACKDKQIRNVAHDLKTAQMTFEIEKIEYSNLEKLVSNTPMELQIL